LVFVKFKTGAGLKLIPVVYVLGLPKVSLSVVLFYKGSNAMGANLNPPTLSFFCYFFSLSFFYNCIKNYLLKLFIKLRVSQRLKVVIDMLEVFLEEIFDFSFIDYPRSDGLFDLLFFLDEDFRSVNFLFFQLTGFNAFIDFGFVFLLFFYVFLNVNEGVVSHFFIVLDFGYLFDLKDRKSVV